MINALSTKLIFIAPIHLFCILPRWHNLMTSTSSLRNDTLQFLNLSLCSKKCSQAILGEFTGSFVFVVSQQFNDSFFVWGGSKTVSKVSWRTQKARRNNKVLDKDVLKGTRQVAWFGDVRVSRTGRMVPADFLDQRSDCFSLGRKGASSTRRTRSNLPTTSNVSLIHANGNAYKNH